MFKDDIADGQGKLTFANGDILEGEWEKGEIHSEVKLTFHTGEKYVGEWKDWELWNGTQYDKDGNIIGKIVNGVEQNLKDNPIFSIELTPTNISDRITNSYLIPQSNKTSKYNP